MAWLGRGPGQAPEAPLRIRSSRGGQEAGQASGHSVGRESPGWEGQQAESGQWCSQGRHGDGTKSKTKQDTVRSGEHPWGNVSPRAEGPPPEASPPRGLPP